MASALAHPWAEGHDVGGEAVFQEDPSVSLAVQFGDEPVPVDHHARPEPVNTAPETALAHTRQNPNVTSSETQFTELIAVKSSQLFLNTF